jgi:outer membrane protein OmpA-like peptidoglycan-associated protein
MSNSGLAYPLRSLSLFAAVLALFVLWGIADLPLVWAGLITAAILVSTAWVVLARSMLIRRMVQRGDAVLQTLNADTADLTGNARTNMPLLLIMGDGLPLLFSDDKSKVLASVRDGAIWVRVDHLKDLAPLALTLTRWRQGKSPDALVLSLAPAVHANQAALIQELRLIRQSCNDVWRKLGMRLPGYLAVYQRMTPLNSEKQDASSADWHSVSSDVALDVHTAAVAFEALMLAEESCTQRAHGQKEIVWRTSSLYPLIQWTRDTALSTLQDPHSAESTWPLHGAAWIDLGPHSSARSPWQHHLRHSSGLSVPAYPASTGRWPFPRPLITALPRRLWISPAVRACAHAVIILAAVWALASWCAARNNHKLLAQAEQDLARFVRTPAANDATRRDALKALTADRDRLERYQRTGIPLHLSVGMYRGATVLPLLDTAIASYQPPAPPPLIVTLDSMSLFASGQASLKPGSTRALVAALDLIKANPGKHILVAGHTDNVGSTASNQRLSILRASAVRDWLTEAAGLAPSRFAIQGYGDSRPIADNQTEDGRAINRRVEITLVPDLNGA